MFSKGINKYIHLICSFDCTRSMRLIKSDDDVILLQSNYLKIDKRKQTSVIDHLYIIIRSNSTLIYFSVFTHSSVHIINRKLPRPTMWYCFIFFFIPTLVRDRKREVRMFDRLIIVYNHNHRSYYWQYKGKKKEMCQL